MPSTIYFSAKQMEDFRRKASSQHAIPEDYPNGWSKSKKDPMQVLKVFSTIKIKKGYVLKAYQYVSGGNGNGIVWAIPEDSNFPEPHKCPILKNTALKCPRPQDALENIMEAIEGDSSDLSYMSASIFAREISEFGAIWHGCSWSSHRIIDEQYDSDELSFEEFDNYDWSEEIPKEWCPSVTKTDNGIIVNFYTFTGLMPAGIVRHVDRYSVGSYCFSTDCKQIMKTGGGYVY